MHIPGTVLVASYLENNGFSHDLQKYYRRSGWLESIGNGAFKRPVERVQWYGALFSLQEQAGISVHVGGKSALILNDLTLRHRVDNETVYLFSPLGVMLPTWFVNYHWGQSIVHIKTSLLPYDLGLQTFEMANFSIRMSSPERAILEYIYKANEVVDLIECYKTLDKMSNLSPSILQQLLECCGSVKVKRIFLYMASKAQHQWLHSIDESKIDLGEGDRAIVKGGRYVAAYHISLPVELVEL